MAWPLKIRTEDVLVTFVNIAQGIDFESGIAMVVPGHLGTIFKSMLKITF